MLKIIVNSDSNLNVGEASVQAIEAQVNDRLGRFEDRLSRVVVHLRDEDGPKSGDNDVRCMMEARPEGMDSINVSDHADTVTVAVNHAARKLEKTLDATFAKLAR